MSYRRLQVLPDIDMIDGEPIDFEKDANKQIVAWVVYFEAVDGKKVLGFTSLEKAQQYEEKYVKQPQSSQDGETTFYENISFDPNRLGDKYIVKIGTNLPQLELWNDEISSINIHPRSSVRVYEHSNFAGSYITFINNSDKYWFIDLRMYDINSNVEWHDNISSIKTW
jgi:hypothetical protein